MRRREIRIPGLRRALRLPPSARSIEREVDDEMRFHLDSRIDDLVGQGMTRDAAEARARAEFGDVVASRRELVEVGRRRLFRWRLVEGVATTAVDLRYAARQMGRAPVFAATIMGVLAVGIGANTAADTIARAVITRPSPAIPHPERLARLVPREIQLGAVYVETRFGLRREPPQPRGLSLGAFNDVATHDSLFDAGGAWVAHPRMRVTTRERLTVANVLSVTAGYFPGLGLRMPVGAAFGSAGPRDADVGSVAVLSHSFWHREYGGDSAVVGQRLTLNGVSLTIVGVAPPAFNGIDLTSMPDRIDIWVPMAMTPTLFPSFVTVYSDGSPNRQYGAFVRLAPGVSSERATAIAAVVLEREYRTHPRCCGPGPAVGISLDPLSGRAPSEIRDNTERNLALLRAVGVFILLISCATAASLLVARAVTRRREIAVRLSLGAARPRVLRQLLTESAFLAGGAMGIGLLGTWWLARAVSARYELPIDLSIDLPTIAFGVAVAAVTALLAGAVPALHAVRVSVSDTLKSGAAGLDVRGLRWQSALTIGQIALGSALVCATGAIAGAGLMGRQVNAGIPNPDHVITAQIDQRGERPLHINDLKEQIRQRLRAIPGVAHVGWSDGFPLVGGMEPSRDGNEMLRVGPDGSTETFTADRTTPWVVLSEPEFFPAAGLHLIQGQYFERGRSDNPAVISEDFARQRWPGKSPLGQRFSASIWGTYMVVGVVPAVHMKIDTTRASPVVYISHENNGTMAPDLLVVRTTGSAAPLIPSIRRALAEVDPRLSVHDIRTLVETRDLEAGRLFDASRIAGLLSAVALLMAAVGMFSVIAFSVGQRTREIGIRIALGARHATVTGLFLRAGMRITLAGVGVGSLLAFVALRVITHLVWGAGLINYGAVAAVALTMPLVAAVAIWIPARRALRVNPVVALRAD